IIDLQFYEKWINNFDILKSCFPIICIDFQIFKNYLYNSNVTFDYIIFDNCLHFDADMKQHLVSKSNKLIYQNNRAQVSNNASFDNPWNDILTKKNNISSSSVCIEGYCDENNKNIVEANYIFNILNNITQRPNFTYPKIGIICNSKSQRDLIQSMLLDIHANKKQGWEKLNHLERNGLKVLFANHLKKEKFDIIIYSFTYSFKNNIENLIDQLQTIDISTLQNLSSNANSEIKVVYSISDLWTEYLLSIDDEKISKILSFLRHRSFLSTNSTFEVANKYHNFIDLILKFITPYFNRDEIKVDKTHWLPIRIECNNTKFALITNGFLFYDNTPELYNFLEKHYMKNEAVIFKPIYFDEFVLNPEIYIKKIAGSIHANNILENDV
ncbi:MAG: hypothetical protein KBA06_01180, partial [Saprospiraceae bacterium]|nr:hypothetical protein [Saprospiraceae bacterium]